MADYRAYALVAGLGLGLAGGLLLSLWPEAPQFSLFVLVPALALFLYGLLATPPAE